MGVQPLEVIARGQWSFNIDQAVKKSDNEKLHFSYFVNCNICYAFFLFFRVI